MRQTASEEIVDGVLPMSDRSTDIPGTEKLFNVPRQLVKVFDRDLKVAGIPKIDDRGRTLDIHALRHSFASLLSAGGVAPRTAQAAMRHSDVNLTMSVYTDPRVLDVRGALDALPKPPLDQPHRPGQEEAESTGTDAGSLVAPMVAPNPGKPCKLETTADKTRSQIDWPSAKKDPKKQSVFRGFDKHAREDSNLQPLVPKTSALSN